jgi:hypothetical protein
MIERVAAGACLRGRGALDLDGVGGDPLPPLAWRASRSAPRSRCDARRSVFETSNAG